MAFLEDFKVNYKAYEAYDKESVEILFEFVDFVAFKKSMLEFKKV
jgi:hypothetical protein